MGDYIEWVNEYTENLHRELEYYVEKLKVVRIQSICLMSFTFILYLVAAYRWQQLFFIAIPTGLLAGVWQGRVSILATQIIAVCSQIDTVTEMMEMQARFDH